MWDKQRKVLILRRSNRRVCCVTHTTCSGPHVASNIQRCTLACNLTPACADAALRDTVGQGTLPVMVPCVRVQPESPQRPRHRDRAQEHVPGCRGAARHDAQNAVLRAGTDRPHTAPMVWLGRATAATGWITLSAAGEGHYEHDNTGGHARSRCVRRLT